jgi:hypothetical protein
MINARSRFASAVIDNRIFVIGGSVSGDECHVEFFDEKANKWLVHF